MNSELLNSEEHSSHRHDRRYEVPVEINILPAGTARTRILPEYCDGPTDSEVMKHPHRVAGRPGGTLAPAGQASPLVSPIPLPGIVCRTVVGSPTPPDRHWSLVSVDPAVRVARYQRSDCQLVVGESAEEHDRIGYRSAAQARTS